jgi:hypothetical protein
MGLFWSDSGPSVSTTEFREKVLMRLEAKDWSREDKEKVKLVFAGHLRESGSQVGIDKKEIKEGIAALKRAGGISSEHLKDLEQYMMNLAR